MGEKCKKWKKIKAKSEKTSPKWKNEIITINNKNEKVLINIYKNIKKKKKSRNKWKKRNEIKKQKMLKK